jgi:hypothetical protein
MQRVLELPISPTLRQGLMFGVGLGAVLTAYNLINSLVSLNANVSDIMRVCLIVTLGAGFVLAGLRAAYQTGDMVSGMSAALLASAISSAIGVITLLAITSVFMDTIRHTAVMVAAFETAQVARYQDIQKFISEEAIGASVFGPMLSLTLAAALGAIGGLIAKSRPGMHPQYSR